MKYISLLQSVLIFFLFLFSACEDDYRRKDIDRDNMNNTPETSPPLPSNPDPVPPHDSPPEADTTTPMRINP